MLEIGDREVLGSADLDLVREEIDIGVIVMYAAGGQVAIGGMDRQQSQQPRGEKNQTANHAALLWSRDPETPSPSPFPEASGKGSEAQRDATSSALAAALPGAAL